MRRITGILIRGCLSKQNPLKIMKPLTIMIIVLHLAMGLFELGYLISQTHHVMHLRIGFFRSSRSMMVSFLR